MLICSDLCILLHLFTLLCLLSLLNEWLLIDFMSSDMKGLSSEWFSLKAFTLNKQFVFVEYSSSTWFKLATDTNKAQYVDVVFVHTFKWFIDKSGRLVRLISSFFLNKNSFFGNEELDSVDSSSFRFIVSRNSLPSFITWSLVGDIGLFEVNCDGKFESVQFVFPFGLKFFDAQILRSLSPIWPNSIGTFMFSTDTMGSYLKSKALGYLCTLIFKIIEFSNSLTVINKNYPILFSLISKDKLFDLIINFKMPLHDIISSFFPDLELKFFYNYELSTNILRIYFLHTFLDLIEPFQRQRHYFEHLMTLVDVLFHFQTENHFETNLLLIKGLK
ncbi:hypothetical protein BpHYR1_013499 [Brachionus plicatilis]|uniref:Uncharacterized protein n=1 Tax=Brachionus plicatilis TaxID=10195 RepID=A0A3M7RWW3_BRAPC|nr:hypothetical protein BpHYR1_013499 [Brachionus plicatilis]